MQLKQLVALLQVAHLVGHDTHALVDESGYVPAGQESTHCPKLKILVEIHAVHWFGVVHVVQSLGHGTQLPEDGYDPVGHVL